MKKLLTILLSVLLVMSLVLPAMASTPMTCTARWRAMPTFPR